MRQGALYRSIGRRLIGMRFQDNGKLIYQKLEGTEPCKWDPFKRSD